MEKYRNASTTDGRMTTTSHPYFAFALMGQYQLLFFNFPGLVHDSQVMELGKIHQKLEQVYETTGGKCCIDLAFSNLERGYLLKSDQDLLDSSAPTRCKQKSWASTKTADYLGTADGRVGLWVKDQFIHEEQGEQQIMLKMFVLLYNMQVRMVGINQIKKYLHVVPSPQCKWRCLVSSKHLWLHPWAWERSHRMGGGGTPITTTNNCDHR